MKIVYVVPGIMSQTELGAEELERRKGFLQERAGKDVLIDITDVEHGPSSIESAYEEYLSIPETVKKVVQAEKEGFDGAIVGCYGDPGIDAMREMVKIPVVGPGETSMLVASMLGHRFSIITVMDSVVPSLEKLARIVGVDGKLASVRAANIPVLDLKKDIETTKRRMIAESEKAMADDRADVIILGCMSMAFMGVSDEMQETLGIPVVNPAVVSLKVLESLITSHLTHSKKAYPVPPKLANKE
ncbi:aspartate/glutamate racemase family protein [Acidobacteriota bacterium]